MCLMDFYSQIKNIIMAERYNVLGPLQFLEESEYQESNFSNVRKNVRIYCRDSVGIV